MSSTNVKRRVIQNYTLHQLLGQGVYGKVYKAKHKVNPQQFAIKVIPVQLFKQNKKLQECTVNQINTLSSIRPSPYIVKYIQMLKTSNNFYFVYQFCNGGTLESKLKKDKILSEKDGLEIFRQLVEAFKVLIEYNIMHRDIKPDNILFHNGIVKLGDFGFCKNLESDNAMTSTMLGSPIYMAPEVLKGEEYSTKADVWSMGVVLFEMLFGYCPFESNSIANLISTIKDSNLRMPLEVNPVSEGTQWLIRRMLVKNPDERVAWGDIFNMQFFRDKEGEGSESKQIEKKQAKSATEKQQEVGATKMLTEKNVVLKQMSPLGKGLNTSISKKDSIEQRERQVLTQPKIHKKQSVVQKSQQKTLTSTPIIQHKHPPDTIPVSHSLAWQNDTAFKNYLANAPKPSKSPQSQKPTIEPDSIHQIGNLNKFFTNNETDVLQSISQSVSNSVSNSITNSLSLNYSLPQVSSKRKQIIQEHQLCTRGIKTAIDIINVQQNITLTYSYLILTTVQSKLRKIQDSILSTESDLRDIYFALTIELTNLEKSIVELKDQLVEQDVNIKNLDNPKGYLGARFREGESQEYVRLWYQMVFVLFGESKVGAAWSRDKDRQEMMEYIRGKLI